MMSKKSGDKPEDDETKPYDIHDFAKHKEQGKFFRKIEENEEKKEARLQERIKEVRTNIGVLRNTRRRKTLQGSSTFQGLEEAIVAIDNKESFLEFISDLSKRGIIQDNGKVELEKWNQILKEYHLNTEKSRYTLSEIKEKIEKKEFAHEKKKALKVPHCMILTKDGYLLAGFLKRKGLANVEGDLKSIESVSTLSLYDFFGSL